MNDKNANARGTELSMEDLEQVNGGYGNVMNADGKSTFNIADSAYNMLLLTVSNNLKAYLK